MVNPLALPEVAVCRNVTGEPDRPADSAVVDCAPAALPSVRVTDACPPASETVVVSLTLPPPTGVQVIETPEMGFPNASSTRTTSGWGNAVPAGAV